VNAQARTGAGVEGGAAYQEALDIANQLNLSHDAACTFVNEFSLLAENGANPNDATIARLYRLSQDTSTGMNRQEGKGRALVSATSGLVSDSPYYSDIVQDTQEDVQSGSFTRLENRMERLEGLLERLLEQKQQQPEPQQSSSSSSN
jgi:hypothetical protein